MIISYWWSDHNKDEADDDRWISVWRRSYLLSVSPPALPFFSLQTSEYHDDDDADDDDDDGDDDDDNDDDDADHADQQYEDDQTCKHMGKFPKIYPVVEIWYSRSRGPDFSWHLLSHPSSAQPCDPRPLPYDRDASYRDASYRDASYRDASYTDVTKEKKRKESWILGVGWEQFWLYLWLSGNDDII